MAYSYHLSWIGILQERLVCELGIVGNICVCRTGCALSARGYSSLQNCHRLNGCEQEEKQRMFHVALTGLSGIANPQWIHQNCHLLFKAQKWGRPACAFKIAHIKQRLRHWLCWRNVSLLSCLSKSKNILPYWNRSGKGFERHSVFIWVRICPAQV